MKKHIKLFLSLVLILISFSLPTLQNISSFSYEPLIAYAKEDDKDEEELEIQQKPPTDDTQEIYNRYKNNSFSLMNKEYKSINKINQFMQNFDISIKSFMANSVIFTGKFNVTLVETLFNLNIANAIKEPIQKMSLKISQNMLGVASSIGILAIAVFMIVKLISTGKISEATKMFGLGLLTFIVLTSFNNPTTNSYYFDGIIEVDNQIENAFAGINPQFQGEPEQEANSVGEKIGAEVFRTNVYEPYLYMNYGTTDVPTIRKQTIEHKGTTYDRIGALLDNDSASEKQIKFVEKVTDYEVDTLNNNVPSYKNASNISNTASLQLVFNLIQMFIFGALGILRLSLQVLLILLPLFLPVIMVCGLVMNGTSLLGNFVKGFLTISFMKASLSLITVVFTSYISLTYNMNIQTDNMLETILSRLAWLIAPMFIYLFRYLLGGIFSKNMRMSSGGLWNSFRHPRLASRLAKDNKQQRKAQREEARANARKKREEAQAKRKSAKEGLNEVKPTNKKFSEQRKQDTRNNPKEQSENKNKEDLNNQNPNRENSNEKGYDNKKGKELQEQRRNQRTEQPNISRNDPTSNTRNELRNNKPNSSDSADKTKQVPSSARAERIAKNNEQEKQRKENDTKGQLTPTKKQPKQDVKQQRKATQTPREANRQTTITPKTTTNNATGSNVAMKQRGGTNTKNMPKTMTKPNSTTKQRTVKTQKNIRTKEKNDTTINKKVTYRMPNKK